MSLFAHNYHFNHSGDKSSLENLVQKYPYFSHAHFLRLKQLTDNDPGYKKAAAKTALHFANPFLLEQQLKQDKAAEDILIVHAITTDADTGVEKTSISIVSEEADEMRDPLPAAEEITDPVPEIKTSIVVNEEKNSPVQKGEGLLFEPLHTTDYFASQGIKLSEAVLPTDKVGRQLKSFTEWLKTMKKVHPAGLDTKAADAPIDPTVQNMAEKSNIEEEVVTESMAEVYIQQGKKQKAREIYEKLSLLNPAKNAYFAAKLNEIQ